MGVLLKINPVESKDKDYNTLNEQQEEFETYNENNDVKVILDDPIELTELTVKKFRKRNIKNSGRELYLTKDPIELEIHGSYNTGRTSGELTEIIKLSNWEKVVAHEEGSYRKVELISSDNNGEEYASYTIEKAFISSYHEHYSVKQGNIEFTVVIREFDDRVKLDKWDKTIQISGGVEYANPEDIAATIGYGMPYSYKAMFHKDGVWQFDKYIRYDEKLNYWVYPVGSSEYSLATYYAFGYRIVPTRCYHHRLYYNITTVTVNINGVKSNCGGYLAEGKTFIEYPERLLTTLGLKNTAAKAVTDYMYVESDNAEINVDNFTFYYYKYGNERIKNVMFTDLADRIHERSNLRLKWTYSNQVLNITFCVTESYKFDHMSICTDGYDNTYNTATYQQRLAAFAVNKNDPTTPSATKVPYIVIAKNHPNVEERKRDYGVIIDKKSNKFVYAIVAETGPENQYREISIKAAWDLGYSTDGTWGPEGDFEFIIFKGTRTLTYNAKENDIIKAIAQEAPKYYP